MTDPAIDSYARKQTDAMVYRTLLAVLLARSTMNSDDQSDEINQLMNDTGRVLQTNTASAFSKTGEHQNIRNLMVANIAEEIAEIRQMAQRIARDLRGDSR